MDHESSSLNPFLPPNFGGVKFQGNGNLTAIGANNRGVVLKNSNLHLSSSNCDLDLKDNANLRVNAENSCLNLISCSNTLIAGIRNTATLVNNTNATFKAEESKMRASENSNLTVDAKKSDLCLDGNVNTNISTTGGNVIAEKNVNLKVNCDGGKAHVKNTENHELKPSTNELINKLEMIPAQSGLQRIFGNFISFGNTKKDKLRLEYVNEVKIEDGRYKLGVFNFKMNRICPGNFDVLVDDNNFQITENKGTTEISLKSKNGGADEKLILCAPVILSGPLDGGGVWLKMKSQM